MSKALKQQHLQQQHGQMPPIVLSKPRNRITPNTSVFNCKSAARPLCDGNKKRFVYNNDGGSCSATNSNDEGRGEECYNSGSGSSSDDSDDDGGGGGGGGGFMSDNEDDMTVIEKEQKSPDVYFLSLLMDPSDEEHDLLQRICEASVDDDDDNLTSLAGSLVAFFQKVDLDVPFVKWCIEREVASLRPGPAAEKTLFRGSTFPMKIYSVFCSTAMNGFLSEVLKEHIVKLSEIYSVDPENCGSQASVSSPQMQRRPSGGANSLGSHARMLSCEFADNSGPRSNPYSAMTSSKRLSAFMLAVDGLVRSVTSSLPRFPRDVRRLVRYAKEALDARFGPSTPQRDQNVVNAMVFLRVICPCVALPDVFGILDKDSVMVSSRKNFRLASALIQALVNGGQTAPTAKSLGIEEQVLLAFKKRNQQKINSFLNDFCSLSSPSSSSSGDGNDCCNGPGSPEIVRPFVLGISPTCVPQKTILPLFQKIQEKLHVVAPHLTGYPKLSELMDLLKSSPVHFALSPVFVSPPPPPITTPFVDFTLSPTALAAAAAVGPACGPADRYFSDTNSVVSGIPSFENDVFTHLLAAQKSMALYLSLHAKREEDYARKLKEKEAEISALRKALKEQKVVSEPPTPDTFCSTVALCSDFEAIDKSVAQALDVDKDLTGASCNVEGKPDAKFSPDLSQDELYRMALYYRAKYSAMKKRCREMKTCLHVLQEANNMKTELVKGSVPPENPPAEKDIQCKTLFSPSAPILPQTGLKFTDKTVVSVNVSGEKFSSPSGRAFQVPAHGRNLSSAAVQGASDVGILSTKSPTLDSPEKRVKEAEPAGQQPQPQSPKKKRGHKKDKQSKK